MQFKLALDSRFSKGEPQSIDQTIARLSVDKYQNKRWATRARLWVDRLACAWLIARFIDKTPKFVWLDDISTAPQNVIGHDYDGAVFTNIGPRTSFEVLLGSFGLENDEKLIHIARAVNSIDLGEMPVNIARSLEEILASLREVHLADDALMKASDPIFDAVYMQANRKRSALIKQQARKHL